MSTDGQGTKCRRNISENLNRLSKAHERYRRQTDRQTDGRAIAYSERHLAKMAEDVAVKKFTFAISSPDEFLVLTGVQRCHM